MEDWRKTFSSKRNICITLCVAVVLLGVLFYFFKSDCPQKTYNPLKIIFAYFATPSGNLNCNPSIGTLTERVGYIVGGVIAILVAVATFQRAKAADKTAEAQKEIAVEQEKGNFQERYKDAVNQLDSNKASIRSAGFYGLYYLSRDNQKYCRATCDILCGYVRERTNNIITVKVKKTDKPKNKFYQEEHTNKPDNEIQSIIDLLTNKEHEKKYPFKSEWIDLSGAYLVGADFTNSILNGANLKYAQMEGAFLYRTHLKGAILYHAKIQGALLYKSQMQEANLFSTNLNWANLQKAELQGAFLQKAQLQGAILQEAQLQGARLEDTQLQGANLKKAQLQGADLKKAQLQGANLYRARLQGADLNKVNLVGTVASETYDSNNITPAQLKKRIREDIDLRTVVSSGGITPKDIENFRIKVNEAKTYLESDFLKDFQNRTKQVIKILSNDHKNKKDNTTFPPKGYMRISAEDYQKLLKEKQNKKKCVITRILEQKAANEIIKTLKAVEKGASKMNKKYPNRRTIFQNTAPTLEFFDYRL